MAAIQNYADILLQATSPRLLVSPANYLTVIPTTNTITSTSGVLTPSTVTIKATRNGIIQGTITWDVSPSVSYSTITDGIVITSSNLPAGTPVIVTANLSFVGNTYSATTTITRKEVVQLGSTGILSGEGGGAITSLDYGNVSGSKPPSNATANFFTTSASNPTGGSDGDAHYNSSTNVMWFKVNGVWTQGGTINASQITVGTLAAARIAANSITADKIATGTITATQIATGTITATQIATGTITTDKLVAGTLTAFTINAGAITGSSTIDIAGSARFSGSTNDGGSLYTIVANASSISFGGGIKGNAGSSGVGVYGDTGTIGDRGTAGVSRVYGSRGVQATNTTGGWALDVTQGYMTINDATLVSNLNADMVDGLHGYSLAKLSGGNSFTGNQYLSSGALDIAGWLQCDDLRIDKTPTTGTGTADFPGNNKPGGTSTAAWVPISLNGTTYYIAVWT